MVREIANSCGNNQMRDVFFEEVETDDPEQYVRDMIRGRDVRIYSERRADGAWTVFAENDGLYQKFLFTEL